MGIRIWEWYLELGMGIGLSKLGIEIGDQDGYWAFGIMIVDSGIKIEGWNGGLEIGIIWIGDCYWGLGFRVGIGDRDLG